MHRSTENYTNLMECILRVFRFWPCKVHLFFIVSKKKGIEKYITLNSMATTLSS